MVLIIFLLLLTFFARLAFLLRNQENHWSGAAAALSFLGVALSGIVCVCAFGFSLLKSRTISTEETPPISSTEVDAAPSIFGSLFLEMTSRQKWGRLILALTLVAWLGMTYISILIVLIDAGFAPLKFLVVGPQVILSSALAIVIWRGQRWARWFFVVWVAFSIAYLLPTSVVNRGWSEAVICFIFAVLISPLIFSRAVSAFLEHQQARAIPWTVSTHLKVWPTVAVLIGVPFAIVMVLYVRDRNKWPESVTNRIAELRDAGVPVTLAEADARYRAITTNSAALEHFNKIFVTLTNQYPPLMAARTVKHKGNHPNLPALSSMASPAGRTSAVSFLERNTNNLQLLHESLAFERCAFPIKITDGPRALLPYLSGFNISAQLLALESVEQAFQTNSSQSAQSIIALLHLAEILQDDPMLLGAIYRDRIVVAACVALHTSLNRTSYAETDLLLMSDRLRQVMAMNDRLLTKGIENERCQYVTVFLGTDREIADYLQQGESGLWMRFSAEVLRGTGRLQRDAEAFLDYIDRFEAAATAPNHQDTILQLNEIESDLEDDKLLYQYDASKRNLLTSTFIPGLAIAMRKHEWTQTLGQITLVALAVERFHNAKGAWPEDLQSLVPKYLSEVPQDPYTGKKFQLRASANGYALSTTGDFNDLDKDDLETSSNEIVFRVER